MVRWIAFDDETAEAVVSKFKRGAAEIREGGIPLDALLELDRPGVLILPSSNPGKVLLATFEPKSAGIRLVQEEPLASRQIPPKLSAPGESDAGVQPSPESKWWRQRSA